MSTSLEELGIQKSFISSLQTHFSITDATPIQKLSIPTITSSYKTHNFILNAETGSGKTLAFILPILQLLSQTKAIGNSGSNQRQQGLLVLILVPTKELASQIYAVLEKLLRSSPLVPGLLNGTDKRKSEKARIRKGLNLIVGTPGRILDHLENTCNFPISSLQWVVLDEADRLLDLGFEKKITKIIEILNERRGKSDNGELSSSQNSSLKFVLCSATIREELRQVLKRFTNLPFKIISSNESGKNETPVQLNQKYFLVPTKLKLLLLAGLLKKRFLTESNFKVVCFVSCCDSVDFHFLFFKEMLQIEKEASNDEKESVIGKCNWLKEGCELYKLHGNLEQSQRCSVMEAFSKSKQNCLLFCTDVAARGLDIPDISLIVQYDVPSDTNDYVHRIGRTARIGRTGEAVLFLSLQEEQYLQYLKGKMNCSISGDDFISYLNQLIGRTGNGCKNERKTSTYGQDSLNNSTASFDKSTDSSNEFAIKDSHLKRELSRIYVKMESQVSSNPDLHSLARRAFTSTVRAYATHQKDHREFFQISRLHLGHVAKSFCLKDAPSNICRKITRTNKGKSDNYKVKIPMKRSISEFDSGI